MQDKAGKGGNRDKSGKRVKQKHVGDETPNPLPDHDYSQKQPPGGDTQANSDSDLPLA